MERRTALKIGAGLAAGVGLSRLALAQDSAANWPAKTVRLIIPFTPGGGPALNDVMGGQVAMTFGNMPTVLPHAKGGKVRAIAVTSAERWFSAPEIPTIAETVPGFVAMSWHGVAFPAAVPAAIVEKLSAAIQRGLASADLQEQFAKGGSRATSMTPRQFATFIREDTERWAPSIKASGARID